MIELAKVETSKKFESRNGNRIFHHRGTEDTEKENNLAGGFSPRPPKPQKKILGVLGVKPLARLLFSLCPPWLCGRKSYSEILLSAIYNLYGRINYYSKMACFELSLKSI